MALSARASSGVSDDGGYYSWTLRIVSQAYFEEQKVFAGESTVTIPAVEGADDSFGFSSSAQVWVRRGDLAVTIENSSATQDLSLGLLRELLPTLGRVEGAADRRFESEDQSAPDQTAMDQTAMADAARSRESTSSSTPCR